MEDDQIIKELEKDIELGKTISEKIYSRFECSNYGRSNEDYDPILKMKEAMG